jgi:hypothetical protein
LDVETANKKFGIAQIIEAEGCSHIIGQAVTATFYAKVSATTNLDNVKCAIIAWNGTADSVTSDVVSAWGIEGTNPTLVSNCTYENTPANLSVTTSWARYQVNATVDTANAKQLILFIWSDVTTTSAGEFLYITSVQLEAGTVATPFERRPYGTELALCQRYYFQDRFTLAAGAWYSVHPYSASSFTLPVVMRTATEAGTSISSAFYDDAGNVSRVTTQQFGIGSTNNQAITEAYRFKHTAYILLLGTPNSWGGISGTIKLADEL